MADSTKKHTIYIPMNPDLGLSNLNDYEYLSRARIDLLRKLHMSDRYDVPSCNGYPVLLDTMGIHTSNADGCIFLPFTGMLEGDPGRRTGVRNFLEFLSVGTSVHIGDPRLYRDGISKPCAVIDTDEQWVMVEDLLKDLKKKKAFSSRVSEIAAFIRPDPVYTGDKSAPAVYGIWNIPQMEQMNDLAIAELDRRFQQNIGKERHSAERRYADDVNFPSYLKPPPAHLRNSTPDAPSPRSHYGVVMFGSATLTDTKYTEPGRWFGKELGRRAIRAISGAGADGIMGAFAEGYYEGAEEYRKKNPLARIQPSHIGISTKDVLRTEGPPVKPGYKGEKKPDKVSEWCILEQLCVLDNREDRLRAFIEGHGHKDNDKRFSDTAKDICIFPGGIGTLEEFSFVMQLMMDTQKMKGRQVHICNTDGYWDKLIAICEKLQIDHHLQIHENEQQMMAAIDVRHQAWLETEEGRSEKPNNLKSTMQSHKPREEHSGFRGYCD